MKPVNTIIFSILVILILVCVVQDNLMEGFFVPPPPMIRMPANNSVPASITTTSRIANNTSFNPVKMNNMNTVNRNVVGRPKSAQEIMQSERKLSNSDIIASGVAAVSMLNNKLKKN
jgi:hypothetical protein